MGIVLRQLGVAARQNAVVKAFHALGSERRVQRAHLVNNAAQRPNVTLFVVRFLLPDFRARVVRRSRLSVQHAVLRDLAHVQIAHLVCAVLALKDVGRLQVSVENVAIVQGFQARSHLHERLPNFPLLKLSGVLLVVHNLLVQVAHARKLHDDAQSARSFIEEGLLVRNHIDVAGHE